jgi:hypothetical protein
MWVFNQASTTARTALIYITAGAMLVIWTGVWYLYLHNNPPETNSIYYWCVGLLMTGLTLMVIGFGLGRIGRAARPAGGGAEVSRTPAIPLNASPTPVRSTETRNGMGLHAGSGASEFPARGNQPSPRSRASSDRPPAGA